MTCIGKPGHSLSLTRIILRSIMFTKIMSVLKTILRPCWNKFSIKWRDPGSTSLGLLRTWRGSVSASSAYIVMQKRQASLNTTTGTKKSFQSDLNKAHWQYLNNNLYQSLEDGNDKSFCSYVRGQRVENVGVAPLKKGGQLHSNRKEKCEILADQFSSVFTKDCDDPYSNTAPHGPSHPPICKLIIKEEGVRKLLEGTLQSPEGVGNWAGPCVHFFISAIAPYWWLAPRGGGYWTKFWRGCATGERQNPPISKGDERSRQAPCLRKLSPWRPICMDPPPNILSSPMPSQPGNCITLQIHLVSITPTIEQQLTST